MQFVIIGTDGSDAEAVNRRVSVRDEHLILASKMKADKSLLFAVAIKNDDNQMVGSIMVVDFPSRAEVDKWLEVEPYILKDVWKNVEVKPAKVALGFDN